MAENINNLMRWDKNVRQWGAQGGPVYQTTIVTVQSGQEQRAQNWINSRGMWNLGNRDLKSSQYQQLLDFFHQARGRLIGFRIRDWMDYADDGRGILGTGVGDPTSVDNVYQMGKRRLVPDTGTGVGAIQKITRPVGPSFVDVPELGNTLRFFVDGVEVGATVDDSTGLVTLPSAVTDANVLTWTGQYDYPARFDLDTFSHSIEAFIEHDAATPQDVWIKLGDVPVVQLRE